MNDLGNLRAIVGSNEFAQPRTSVFQLLQRFDEIVLTFDRGTVAIAVNPGDDTVRLLRSGSNYPHTSVLTDTDPWQRAIGWPIMWAWTLKNNREYVDGLQIEFRAQGNYPAFQFMCEASSITAYVLQAI